MSRTYRKKPVDIQAVRVPLNIESSPEAAKKLAEIADWCNGDITEDLPGRGYAIAISTLEGVMLAEQGDWIIQGVLGEFYPCKNEVFQKTYEPVAEDEAPQQEGLTFGQAIEAVKNGEKVARAGWNGKGMWLALSGGMDGHVVHHSNFWSEHNAAWARSNPDGHAKVLPSITMKTATGEILMGWLASQTDMLAEDWLIVPSPKGDA
ncbi:MULTISPECIES: DUF2829 domain-containing protein [Halocynthiibacter]|uniref:DUF2829 domain-containing protein n=1 Tax=Halocynthiibacter halioticoli TaxID=2986804 RepID=A0AAE3J328_9RHOB|nr:MULTISPECIES: DUF2829 domain-containing protein [Halocynthiibacter]MCV6826011.1 DUF2829 domain-containing protein [Halocynthiibacter halioticoli]MCW4059012.1 DUF2829 domain-containing protein [Halocynthiibacter sp. SDUM655004]